MRYFLQRQCGDRQESVQVELGPWIEHRELESKNFFKWRSETSLDFSVRNYLFSVPRVPGQGPAGVPTGGKLAFGTTPPIEGGEVDGAVKVGPDALGIGA